jgi:hypothetical protein
MPGLERGNRELNDTQIRDTTIQNDPMDRHGFETHPGDVGGGAVHFFYPPAHRVRLKHTRRDLGGVHPKVERRGVTEIRPLKSVSETLKGLSEDRYQR